MSITKTRWKIESDRIIIQPFGLLFILAGVLALIFAGLFIAFRAMGEQNIVGTGPVASFLFITLALFFLGGFTYIVFDRTNGVMKKMLFGFIPVRNIPFNKLQGVNIVTQGYGGFSFRLFTKAHKYGRGITLSSGYSKDTDRNATAFSNEVVPLIHQFLDAADPLPQEKLEAITDFKYFIPDGGVYTLKTSKIGLLIFGVACFALGIHECTSAAWMKDLNPIGKILMTAGPIVFGVLLIAAAFTKVTFNTGTRMIERKSPIRLGNLQHPFEHFVTFQTVRKTYNGLYSGTEVHMYFQKPGENKEKAVVLASFRNTQKIERFIQEVNSIMR
ncbi:hypothetical protein SAMN05428949_0197 [Chitinophaga sp. YR627]|uniref:hypothetical protein n=1 Tax=Chitinophaga sp. YR627 TaxID=1881041 RepID=UPI0008EBC865|nr:hypothetical protein [Chitinophaga sp. YR627]SFM61966.1 hypothetical protein SAMN05428949_0197 [Chitinophaga sp. YR627]